MQNNLVELMSLLVFVMPELFANKKEQLKKMFSMFPVRILASVYREQRKKMGNLQSLVVFVVFSTSPIMYFI
jgi:hypothetical protein